jgi:transposase, IS5 family
MASAANERLALEAGVKQVALPHVDKPPSGRVPEERGRRFKRGYRFRAGSRVESTSYYMIMI